VADDSLSDAAFITLADGLRWQESGGRTRTEPDLTAWLGKRASAGSMAPRGFPRDNKFN
jgi:topoisomerase-4 subunit A